MSRTQHGRYEYMRKALNICPGDMWEFPKIDELSQESEEIVVYRPPVAFISTGRTFFST